MEAKTDEPCNDIKTLQNYMSQVEQLSYGRTTHT